RVAVVRRCREKEPVLEPGGEVAHRACELRLDPVAPAARGSCVVRLVEDQETSRQELPEPLAHRVGVVRVDEQVVCDEEPAVGPQRVAREAALPTDLCQVAAIQNLEGETESLLQLCLPLLENGWWRRDDNRLRLLAKQELAGDQPGFDRLAETGVVSDE